MVTGAGAGPRAGRVRGERARGPSAALDMALRRRPSLVLLLLLVRGESAGLRQTLPEGTRRGERVWWRGGLRLRASGGVREGSRGLGGPAQVRGQGYGGPGIQAERGAVLEMPAPRDAGPGLGVRVWGWDRRYGSGEAVGRCGGREYRGVPGAGGPGVGSPRDLIWGFGCRASRGAGSGVRVGSRGLELRPSANKADWSPARFVPPTPSPAARPGVARGPPEPGVGLSPDPRPGWRPWAAQRRDHTAGGRGRALGARDRGPNGVLNAVSAKHTEEQGTDTQTRSRAPRRLAWGIRRTSQFSESLSCLLTSSRGVFRVYTARPQVIVRGWSGRTRKTKAAVLKAQ